MKSLSAMHRILLAIFICLASWLATPAMAIEKSQGNPDTDKPFASVWRLKGDVFATSKSGTERRLREGNNIQVGERVRASANGEAVLKAADAGLIAVRPGAEFIPERFAADGKTSDHQILRLVTGSLRLISGWIGQLNRNEQRVITPSATIGIRGTDHEPYVLPAEMANATYRPGTYDKVNRGATVLDANGGSVDIESGKVGFARDPKAEGTRTRALMTLLLPVLLNKVPEFYVPGSFDQELDRYSETADSLSIKQLEKRTGTKFQPAAKTSQNSTSTATETAPINTPQAITTTGCQPKQIGEMWLTRFDQAIVRRDLRTILGLFTADIVAKATVRNGERLTTLEFGREEMVQSTLNSIASLKDYQQRRVSLEASLAESETETSCQRIIVKSIAIEQGLMNGKSYRFEALEEYLLEQRNGEWLAVKASTTQR